jgi:hypothetical protein
MNQQTLEVQVPLTAQSLSDGKPVEALVRMWDEAERAIEARIPLRPAPRQPEPQEQSERVRYAYD